jgi:hypothetical protein
MTLYKYVVADRTDILERGLVRFTHPNALNDLAELRPAFGQIFTADYADHALDKERIVKKAYEECPESVRQTFTPAAFEEFTLAQLASKEGKIELGKALNIVNAFAPELRTLMYKSFDQMIGVLSLSETWDNAPMWAHYADQHKGFVIGFDDSHEYFHRMRSDKDEFYHLRQVVYTDASIEIRSFSDLSSGTRIFLTKDKSWANEREWRMLVPLSDADEVKSQSNDPVHLFHLPGSTVESVIIGVRASDDLTSKLARILHGSTSLAHVKMLQAVVDDDRGGLRLIPSIPKTS